jgi:chemotaxis regulatin CheY-phosphate phosphatase CheZ
MYTTTTKMRLRKEFMDEHPEKKVLAGNAADFKSDYVEWLERQLNDLRIANVVGRSEQLLCSCDNPNGFKEMEEGRETCSKCKKPY